MPQSGIDAVRLRYRSNSQGSEYHGGVKKEDLAAENLEALEKGLPNLLQHVENVTQHFGLPAVVAINEFPTDTEAELKLVEEKCKELGVNVVLSQVWGKGGEGGLALAEEVLRLCEKENHFQFVYPLDVSIESKIQMIAQKIYRADGVIFEGNAKKQLETIGRSRDSTMCQSAWLKPSSVFQTIRLCWEPQEDFKLQSQI